MTDFGDIFSLYTKLSHSADDNGNVKFQPLYKSCHVNRIPTHLLLSYRNISVVSEVEGRGPSTGSPGCRTKNTTKQS